MNGKSQNEKGYFGIPELDALVSPPTSAPSQPPQPASIIHHNNDESWDFNNAINSARKTPQEQNPKNTKSATGAIGGPILELISPPYTHHLSGAGTTSLIYLVVAIAILPSTLLSIPIGGHNAAVVILDPLCHFSFPRLAQTMVALLKRRLSPSSSSSEGLQDSNNGFGGLELEQVIKHCIQTSLPHIHSFRPQSWASLLGTLDSLPDYLFDSRRNRSMDRRIQAIILEEVETFYWNVRSNTNTTIPISNHETAELRTSKTGGTILANNPLTSASSALATGLLPLSCLLSTSLVLSSHSAQVSSFRAPLPTFWPPGVSVTKLAVRRLDVVRFAPGISVEEAEGERDRRWEAVCKGRIECWKVGGREEEAVVLKAGREGGICVEG